MTETFYDRTRLMLGEHKLMWLCKAKVAILGIGGVGSHCCEALARAGIGSLMMLDFDTIRPSNINRQIHALQSTVGQMKTAVMKRRLMDINPNLSIIESNQRLSGQDDLHFLRNYDVVVDAIDHVPSKLQVAEFCDKNNISLISAMGAANKYDPHRFQVADIYQTNTCPLAKVMRKELKKRGVRKLTVIFSDEVPQKPSQLIANRDLVLGSMSFVPPVVGYMLAAQVIEVRLEQRTQTHSPMSDENVI